MLPKNAPDGPNLVWITFSPSREFGYSEFRRCGVQRADSGGRTRYGREGSTSSGPRIAFSVLESEQAVYEANLSKWLSDHEGEYVLIKGDKVDGFYESRDEALTAGYSRFGIGPLFVKQVSPSEPVQHIPGALI